MRIGILTLPLHTNYGGILQAYALQTTLERMGHEACLIEVSQELHPSPAVLVVKYAVRAVKKYVLGRRSTKIRWEDDYNRRLAEQAVTCQFTRQFVDQHLHVARYASYDAIGPGDFDAIVVGSDQIWRKKYVPVLTHSYLDFASGWTSLRRVAYAASFGTDTWEYTPDETRSCARLLARFDSVSVREADGVQLCAKRLGYASARQALDPTLLLTAQDYRRCAGLSGEPVHRKGLLCYIIDSDATKQQMADRIARQRGLTPFVVNSRAEDTASTDYDLRDRIQPPVEQWLQGFADADYVVTDSYHACIFALLFGRQFVALGNAGRGMSRFRSLLTAWGLADHIIAHPDSDPLPADYDPDHVHQLIAQGRQASLDLLAEALGQPSHIGHLE